MQKQKKLQIAHALFTLIVFVSLGTIIVSKKAGVIFIPKVEKKFNEYLQTNYSNMNIENNISKENIKYKDASFKIKITDKVNKNLYFYLIYKDKKIKDTYKVDYLEGKTLIHKIENDLEKEILEKTSVSTTATVLNKLNHYTENVKERIKKEKNLASLKFYKINKELTIKNFSSQEIVSQIDSLITTLSNKNITPKYYEITITSQEDITKSIKINNINESFITNPNKFLIINDIINDNNSKLLKENKITYEYLN